MPLNPELTENQLCFARMLLAIRKSLGIKGEAFAAMAGIEPACLADIEAERAGWQPSQIEILKPALTAHLGQFLNSLSVIVDLLSRYRKCIDDYLDLVRPLGTFSPLPHSAEPASAIPAQPLQVQLPDR